MHDLCKSSSKRSYNHSIRNINQLQHDVPHLGQGISMGIALVQFQWDPPQRHIQSEYAFDKE